MGLMSNHMVGLIELTPSSNAGDSPADDDTLEATFQRLVRDELDAPDRSLSRSSSRKNRLDLAPAASHSFSATSVVYIDSDQLNRELQAEWSRLRRR
jgi:hypothetical protein